MGWTAEAYRKMLASLLPLGRVWNRESDSVLGNVLSAISEELARLDTRMDDLTEERSPSTADELIDEWETDLGLPSECDPEPPTTLPDRRTGASSRYTMIGRADKRYFEEMAEAALDSLVDVAVEEFNPGSSTGDFSPAFSTSFTKVASGSGQFQMLFYNTGPFEFILFAADGGCAGDSLARVPFVDIAACQIEKWKPAHMRALYRVEGAPFSDGVNQIRNPGGERPDLLPVPTGFRSWDLDNQAHPYMVGSSALVKTARDVMEWLEYYSRHYSFNLGGDGSVRNELSQPNDSTFIPLYPPYPAGVEFGGYGKTAGLVPGSFNGVPNPGFEEGDTTPDHWTITSANEIPFTEAWTVQAPRSGIRCVKIVMTSAPKYVALYPGYIEYSDPCPNQIVCGWWHRAENLVQVGPTVRARLGADYVCEDGTTGSSLAPVGCNIPVGTSDWTYYTCTFTFTGSPIKRFRPYFYLRDVTGEIWCDDMSVVAYASAEASKQKLIIQHKSEDETEAVIDWGAGPFDWKEESYPNVPIVLRSFATAFDDCFAKYVHRLVKGFRPVLHFRDYSGEMYWDDLFAKFTDYVIEWPIYNRPGAFRHEFDDSFDRYWSGDFDRHVFSTDFHKPLGYTYPWGNYNRNEFGMGFLVN